MLNSTVKIIINIDGKINNYKVNMNDRLTLYSDLHVIDYDHVEVTKTLLKTLKKLDRCDMLTIDLFDHTDKNIDGLRYSYEGYNGIEYKKSLLNTYSNTYDDYKPVDNFSIELKKDIKRLINKMQSIHIARITELLKEKSA